MTIAFLCTRVIHPDIEDWKKLTRLIGFLAQTIDNEKITGVDDLKRMQTFIDSSHTVYDGMRGHTGGTITFGTGVLNESPVSKR